MRDGDEYVINGRKWWTSGAGDPRCKIAIFMGKTDPSAPVSQATINDSGADGHARGKNRADAYGVRLRPRAARPRRSHVYENVRVPASNILLGEGRGFEIAQGRLGPGRIHHCMRCIGVAERALETMCKRVQSRVAFGKPIAEQGTIRADIARLAYGNRASPPAHSESRLHDGHSRKQGGARRNRDDQSNRPKHGLAGSGSGDSGPRRCWRFARHFLAAAWAGVRTLRMADGPDEVHMEAIAKNELRKPTKSPARSAP